MRRLDLIASPRPDEHRCVVCGEPAVYTDRDDRGRVLHLCRLHNRGDVPRDLFGDPIDSPHEQAPKYRPRKPVQQPLALAAKLSPLERAVAEGDRRLSRRWGIPLAAAMRLRDRGVRR